MAKGKLSANTVAVSKKPSPSLSSSTEIRESRFAVGRTGRVVAHLDDPHAAVFVEANGDGVDDIRLVGDKLDLQPVRNDDMRERFLRGDRAADRRLLRGVCACGKEDETVRGKGWLPQKGTKCHKKLQTVASG